MYIGSFIYSVLKPGLVGAYLAGTILGAGLHLHATFSHEHGENHHHSHAWEAHVHQSSTGSPYESVSPVERDHRHPVPLLQLIAVRASTSTIPELLHHATAYFVDLPRTFYLDPPRIVLLSLPLETSPPLHSLAYRCSSGLAPPTT